MALGPNLLSTGRWLMPYSTPEKRRAGRKKSYLSRKDRILAKEKQYRADRPEAKRETQYKRRYGITIEQFDAMVKAQGNRCAICTETFKPPRQKMTIHVDHCHETMKVRGLLCARCNVGIGLLNDSIERMKLAIEYLSGKRPPGSISAG